MLGIRNLVEENGLILVLRLNTKRLLYQNCRVCLYKNLVLIIYGNHIMSVLCLATGIFETEWSDFAVSYIWISKKLWKCENLLWRFSWIEHLLDRFDCRGSFGKYWRTICYRVKLQIRYRHVSYLCWYHQTELKYLRSRVIEQFSLIELIWKRWIQITWILESCRICLAVFFLQRNFSDVAKSVRIFRNLKLNVLAININCLV